MSEEIISLDQVVQKAVSDFLAESDGGMLTSFIFSGEKIDEDGRSIQMIVYPETQSMSGCLGLAKYAENTFTELQRRDILELIYCDEYDEEE